MTDPTPDPRDLRALAGEWHSGQWSDLYAYASSGHLPPALPIDWENAADEAEREDHPDAAALREAVDHFGRLLRSPDRLAVECGGHDYGAPTYVSTTGAGDRWYLVYVADCFDPPTYLVAADGESDAIEQWADAYGAAAGVLVGPGTGTPLEDYGATDEERADRLTWTDAGPADLEAVHLIGPVRVTVRD